MQTVAEAQASAKANLVAAGVAWATPAAAPGTLVSWLPLQPIGQAAVPAGCMFVEITTGVLSFKDANGVVHVVTVTP